ncbi:MAG: hypothetical protein PHC60_02450 [Heliobacteriaceae bacterium]|nr:hypothetical protein [Heliobacteriaceae bacterium]MDD4587240.1 hypothetical protein [Heliobacteriaceae bacterium]
MFSEDETILNTLIGLTLPEAEQYCAGLGRQITFVMTGSDTLKFRTVARIVRVRRTSSNRFEAVYVKFPQHLPKD